MISDEEVQKVAYLARMAVSTSEAKGLATELSNVLKNFEQVAKVNTDGVEPLVTPTDVAQFWRKDQVEKWGSVEEAMQNAPQVVGNLFKVPPVVG